MKFTKILKRGLWTGLTILFVILMVAAIVGGNFANSYKKTINDFFGLENYDITYSEDAEPLHFSSEYEKADGTYDDAALWQADKDAADQVQREGTTILWNEDAAGNAGLPLDQGSTVSLFSHSSVDFVYSGVGSGNAYTGGVADLKTAFTNAGLKVNETLWNFYKSGAGSGDEYNRANYSGVNEVPWSLVQRDCSSSFNNTAGVFVLSRRAGENGETDSAMITADTLTGDYFQLAQNEKDTIEAMVNLKKSGVLSKVIIMLNTAQGINFDVLWQYKDDIDCCIWVCQPGWEGINEIARIFSGESDPSGHLVDAFLFNNFSNPASVNAEFTTYDGAYDVGLKDYQFQANYIVYAENIYLGYKYYETRYEDAVMGNGNASSATGAANSENGWCYAEEVAFPFGYGWSYAEFEYSDFSVTRNQDGSCTVTLTVTNIGEKAGMDAVQIYIQKPYTEYDKDHKLEQASVNLCGYKKTGLIKPQGKEQVTIEISADSFKTYDDDGYKTYIMEEGEYYIAAGRDSHEAVNNILAKKGYSPANTNSVMDAAGNANLVWTWENAERDTTTFSKSSTEYAITNQFEDTDWNKYENKGPETVEYLSRSDWSGTYPQPIHLSITPGMAEDLDWDKTVVANPNDKMPKYEQEHVFDIIDMRGLDYDDAAWDTLLDQTSLEEQINFLGKAYHGTPAIQSINFKGELCVDGPLGVRQKYKTDPSASEANGYTMSFPCSPLIAASYNDELAYKVGKLKGEDMLHSGTTGMYGVGANMHRTIWGGRAYEYYSEDAFITAMMCKWEVAGIQESGCYVNIKHFALNDQESNRHGVNIWCNEQAIREIYLYAFQPAVEEADATGMMSSFTRFGTLWSGAHYGLCTEVLRNEWGFEGFVISDCAWREYMGVVDGLVGGNDNILYEGTDLTAYYEAETNATVAQLIRQSVHRVLYVLANSNAMEGYAPGMTITPATNWWQITLIALEVLFGIFAAASAILMVLSFVLVKQRRKVLIAEGRMNEKGQPLKKNGQPVNLKVRYTVTASAIAAVVLALVLTFVFAVYPIINGFINEDNFQTKPGDGGGGAPSGHVCENVCPICGKCKDPDCTDSACADKCPGHLVEELPAGYTVYNFEAECCELVTNDPALCHAGNEGPQTQNPSGGQYIMNMSKVDTAVCTFNITSESQAQAVLILRMGLRESAYTFDEMFTITVNGTSVDSDCVFPVMPSGSKQYFAWTDIEVAMINLQEGENTIVLSKVKRGLNFDTLKLATAADVEWTSEVGVGHTYGAWEMITEPTLESKGKLASYCETCRAYKEAIIPEISEENGYIQEIITPATETTFGTSAWKYVYEGNTFELQSLIYPTAGETTLQRFECETMILGGNAKANREGGSNNPSGGYYVGGFSSNDASIQFKFESDSAVDAVFYIGFGCRNDRSINFNKAFNLTLNGSKVTVSNDVVFDGADSTFNYFNWKSFAIVTLHLQEGENVLILEDNNKAVSSNLDYFEFLTPAKLTAKR